MAVQLVVSTLCKYRLTSLKQVTRLCKKQLLLYKPRNSTDLKCLHTPVVFLIEKKTSIFAVIQHASDPTEQSPRQFVPIVVYRHLHSSCRTCMQHYCPKVQPRLQVDRYSYVNCCSSLWRRRRLQRITGSSLATTCVALVLQRRGKQKQCNNS